MKNCIKWSALACILGTGLLFGCGGSSSSSPQEQEPGPSGKIVQGPVSGATVFVDDVTAGTRFFRDPAEIATTTAADGSYTLPDPPTYSHVLVSQGGTDTLTGQGAIQMVAPSGSKNVSPLTTMVALAASPAEADVIKAKIKEMGADFDADISTEATSAVLMLAKSVETVVKSISNATSGGTSAAAQSQSNAIQAQTMKALAQTVAGSTSAALSAPATLNTAMNTAVTAAITAITADTSNANVVIPAGAAQAIAEKAVTVAATVVGATITDVAPVSNSVVVAEATLITTTVKDALNTALAETVAGIKETVGFVVTETPATYVPPAISVVTTPITTDPGTTGGTGGSF